MKDGNSDFNGEIPLESMLRADVDLCPDFRFWIADFGFKVFCLFIIWIKLSNKADLKF